MKHWKWIASTGLVAVLAIAYVAADASLDRQGAQDKIKSGGNPFGLILQLFDGDQDGQVTRAELTSNDAAFDTLDQNQDGVLSADDFPRGPRGRRMAGMLGARIARVADTDESGSVTEAEWQALVATIQTDAEGVIVPEGLHQVLGLDRPVGSGRGPGPGPDHPAPTADDLNALFSRLDRDENGVLEGTELKSISRAARTQRPGRGGADGMRGPGPRGPMADTDESGDVSAAEWQAAFAEMDENGDGVLTRDELRPERGDRPMRRHRRR